TGVDAGQGFDHEFFEVIEGGFLELTATLDKPMFAEKFSRLLAEEIDDNAENNHDHMVWRRLCHVTNAYAFHRMDETAAAVPSAYRQEAYSAHNAIRNTLHDPGQELLVQIPVQIATPEGLASIHLLDHLCCSLSHWFQVTPQGTGQEERGKETEGTPLQGDLKLMENLPIAISHERRTPVGWLKISAIWH
ncbi:hypothetical protein JW905_00255, partial [bacterium]|nr:hypothetical protein [candidate division CSSED10-310 bacterium]